MRARARGASMLGMLCVIACGGEKVPPPPAPDSSPAAIESPVDSTLLLFSRGAAVAIGVEAAPGRADSILAAEGMTIDEYERLMYRIASDSAMRRLFEQALQGR